MDKNSVDWRGHWVALVTPFDADGNVDEAAFRLNVEQCISTVGVTGLVPCGCTGEFWAQTNEERKRVIKACVETAAGRVPVVAGTGAIRTADVIELSDYAGQAGCDGVMIVPPFFVKPSADDIVAHYRAVSDAVDIPILLYNIPSAAVNALTPALVDRLADIDNVVAIKESSFDFNNFYQTIVVAGDRLRVFGYELPGLMVGAVGSIHVHANYWDERASELYHAFDAGDLARAREIQDTSLAIEEHFRLPGLNYYVAVKAAMNYFGRPGGYPRLPLRPLGEPQLSELGAALAKLGVTAVKPPVAAVAE